MSENVLQTLQKLIQDVIAPDVRETKVRIGAVEKQSETQFKSLQDQIASIGKQSEAQYKAILSAIGEAKAQNDLETLRKISVLSERIAVLESTRH